jgi:hypothetical protein
MIGGEGAIMYQCTCKCCQEWIAGEDGEAIEAARTAGSTPVVRAEDHSPHVSSYTYEETHDHDVWCDGFNKALDLLRQPEHQSVEQSALESWARAILPDMECRGDNECDHCVGLQILEENRVSQGSVRAELQVGRPCDLNQGRLSPDRLTDTSTVDRPLEIMEQYLEQIVKPGLETAKTEDDELRLTNFYNGQKQAYEHCIGLIKRTTDAPTVDLFTAYGPFNVGYGKLLDKYKNRQVPYFEVENLLRRITNLPLVDRSER